MLGNFLLAFTSNGNTSFDRNGTVILTFKPLIPLDGPQLKFKPFAASQKVLLLDLAIIPHTAILSCPCHYHHLLLKTFMPLPTTSTPVFQPLQHGIQLIRTRLRDTWPPHLLQRYRWGLHWDRRLPSAYILPKHSRDWSKARPIVSYTHRQPAPHSARRSLQPFTAFSRLSSRS